jgi:hypothetical protein
MYLGNQPALSYTSFAKQDFTTSATTSYTLDNPVANANELALFINFVRQEPTTAYSASGTSLTLTSATSASDDMYCVYLGKAVQTVNPPNASVGTSQLVDDAVTKDKVSNLMYPAFEAKLNGDQFPSNSTLTTLSASGEIFDTDGCYNNTGSTVTLNGISVPAYSFAPNVAGKYYIFARVNVNATGSDNVSRAYVQIFKNTNVISIGDFNSLNNSDIITPSAEIIVELNGTSDYVTAKGYGTVTSDTLRFKGDATESRTYFGAYRIGD